MDLAAWLFGVGAAACVTLGGCKGATKQFSTTVEVMQVRSFGSTAGAKTTDLDVRFDKCPGDARQIMRVGKEFSGCTENLKVGAKVKAEVSLSYNSERGSYRNEIVALGDCKVKLDSKDEANYQTYENCSEVKASGMVVGVRCERTRGDALLKVCPWLRRN